MKRSARALICMMAVVSLFGAAEAVNVRDAGLGGVVYAARKSDMQGVDGPAVYNNIKYDGEPKALIESHLTVRNGNDDVNAFHYYVSTKKNLNATKITEWMSLSYITATDPGTYYIYYMIDGNSEYNTYYCDEPVIVTIKGTVKTMTITEPEPLDPTYNGEEQELCSPVVVTDPQDKYTVTYSLNGGAPSEDIPKACEPGEYTVGYTVTATGYAKKTGSITVTINEQEYQKIDRKAPVSMDEPGYKEHYIGSGDKKKYRYKDGSYSLVEDAQIRLDYYEMELNGDEYTITGYNGTDTDIIIPAEYNGHRITKIGRTAFEAKDIKTAELCGITYIDDQAFLGCASLEKVICTGELNYIGYGAFADTGLDDLIITGSNTMNVLSAGTLPADANVYVMGSSPAETVFVNYYTRTLNTDTSALNILSFVWNGDECTLNVTNHASGDTTEISADVTSQNGRYTAEAEFMGAVLTDEKVIPVEVVTEMQMTADSSKVMLDLYITLPENSEGLTVTVDGDEVKPENGVCTADIRTAAKDMGKKHTITVTQDGETVFEKTVSAADYLKALLADNSYSELHPTVKAMLCYFAAAQNYFGTGETDGFVNEGTEGAGFDTLDGVTIAHTAPEKADIDAALARAGLDEYMEYNSMNMSFTADTSLLIAFRLNDPAQADEAMEALGNKVYGTGIEIYTDGTGKFVILKVPNIPIKKLGDTAVTIGDLDIAGTALLDKVINGNYSEKTTLLCKGLYAYYLAAE